VSTSCVPKDINHAPREAIGAGKFAFHGLKSDLGGFGESIWPCSRDPPRNMRI